MNPRISVLADEFNALRAKLNGLDELAATEKRDLTDDERTEYDGAVTRMETIGTDIDEIEKRSKRFEAVAEATTRAIPAPARTNSRIEIPSHGEQLKILRDIAHGDTEAKVRWDTMAEGATLSRSLQHGKSTDGISPTTIEGDLINFVDANRYAVNASNRKPLPDNRSRTFQRPRVTQHTSVGIQTSESDVLSSQVFTLTGDTVTKNTYGGVISISEQEEDWTDPAMLGLIPTDLAQSYAITTDNVLCDAIEAGVTTNLTSMSLTAAPDVFIAGVAVASMAVYTTSKRLPDTLFVAPDRWSYIVGLTGSDDHPLFPVSNPVNSGGTNAAGVRTFEGLNVLGLNVVVDPNFSSNFWTVAASSLVESYEQQKGLLSVAAPSTLETIVAYRGYFATKVYAQALQGLHV